MKLGFFQTVFLLLKTSRKRSRGRARRQKQLLNHKTGNSNNVLEQIGYALMFIFMGVLHIAAAFAVNYVISDAQRFSYEKRGCVVVSHTFLKAVDDFKQTDCKQIDHYRSELLKYEYRREAKRRSDKLGGSKDEQEKFLRTAVAEKPKSAFIEKQDIARGIKHLKSSDALATMLGSFVLIWWLIMLTFQGEGLELDIQRRRHPMWEWLLSHPIHPGAVFLSEMISPFAANPIYLTAPLFVGTLFSLVHGVAFGILALITSGIPLAVAAASFGKSLEISIMLRCPPRSRGALIGLMGWLGYAAMISFIFGIPAMSKIVNAIGGPLYPLAQTVSSPMLGWFIGAREDGSFSLIQGMGICWFVSLLMISLGVAISIWSTQKGLSGTSIFTGPSPHSKTTFQYEKNVLYRKELLWFIRDRGAIVQVFLIPLTIACFQLFNLRKLLENAYSAWHTMAGVAVIFGTYFLWILGPRSLASDGTALWIAQTWPRGMEDLLKAKAKLWCLISSVIVFMVLGLTALRFPSDTWKLSLIGLGWLMFGKSMAEKTVTLVSASASSGEPEKIPQSRRMAASLGMLTFGIGILTKQWQLMCLGIVYSWMTSAAMWQNFRARLPYIFDPWSEKVPPPPTVMHAMIAISVLIEAGAVVIGIFLMIAGREHMAMAQSISYALIAAIVMLFTMKMMANRDLPARKIWSWEEHYTAGKILFLLQRTCAALLGLSLAAIAHAYLKLITQIGPIGEMIQCQNDVLNNIPGLRISFFFCAVFIAPFAEEFLFRGMLFRALDKEWGGWKALVGSSAFFAMYHPPVAWLPVGLMGLINAILFKKTGRLAPAVILHMVYNAVVLTL